MQRAETSTSGRVIIPQQFLKQQTNNRNGSTERPGRAQWARPANTTSSRQNSPSWQTRLIGSDSQNLDAPLARTGFEASNRREGFSVQAQPCSKPIINIDPPVRRARPLDPPLKQAKPLAPSLKQAKPLVSSTTNKTLSGKVSPPAPNFKLSIAHTSKLAAPNADLYKPCEDESSGMSAGSPRAASAPPGTRKPWEPRLTLYEARVPEEEDETETDIGSTSPASPHIPTPDSSHLSQLQQTSTLGERRYKRHERAARQRRGHAQDKNGAQSSKKQEKDSPGRGRTSVRQSPQTRAQSTSALSKYQSKSLQNLSALMSGAGNIFTTARSQSGSRRDLSQSRVIDDDASSISSTDRTKSVPDVARIAAEVVVSDKTASRLSSAKHKVSAGRLSGYRSVPDVVDVVGDGKPDASDAQYHWNRRSHATQEENRQRRQQAVLNGAAGSSGAMTLNRARQILTGTRVAGDSDSGSSINSPRTAPDGGELSKDSPLRERYEHIKSKYLSRDEKHEQRGQYSSADVSPKEISKFSQRRENIYSTSTSQSDRAEWDNRSIKSSSVTSSVSSDMDHSNQVFAGLPPSTSFPGALSEQRQSPAPTASAPSTPSAPGAVSAAEKASVEALLRSMQDSVAAVTSLYLQMQASGSLQCAAVSRALSDAQAKLQTLALSGMGLKETPKIKMENETQTRINLPLKHSGSQTNFEGYTERSVQCQLPVIDPALLAPPVLHLLNQYSQELGNRLERHLEEKMFTRL